MHNKRFNSPLFLVLACTLALAAGCKPDPALGPIFHTLENEEPIVDRGLSNEITVYKVVTDGSDYYAAAGKVYTRAVSGGEWTAVAVPEGARCMTLAYLPIDDALYAGFFDRSTGGGLGLWKLELAGGGWTRLPDIPASAEITMLKVIDLATDRLFVSTLESKTGKLYYYVEGNPATFQPAPITLPFSDDQVFVRDIVHDGSDYWLAAGPYLYSTDLSAFIVPAGAPTGVEFRGLLYSSGGAAEPPAGVYLSAYDASEAKSRIHHYDGAWSSSGAVSTTFTEFLAPAQYRLWVGTMDSGYYDFAGTDAATLLDNMTRRPESTIDDLWSGAVLRFAQNGTAVFACTSLAGLWVSYDLGDGWSRE